MTHNVVIFARAVARPHGVWPHRPVRRHRAATVAARKMASDRDGHSRTPTDQHALHRAATCLLYGARAASRVHEATRILDAIISLTKRRSTRCARHKPRLNGEQRPRGQALVFCRSAISTRPNVAAGCGDWVPSWCITMTTGFISQQRT